MADAYDIGPEDSSSPPVSVGILIYDEVDDVAVVGPAMVFTAANRVEGSTRFVVDTVARHDRPVTTIGGLTIVPDRTISGFEPDPPFGLVLPGAAGSVAPAGDPELIAWLAAAHPAADFVITVCTGIRLLSRVTDTSGFVVPCHPDPDAVTIMADASAGAGVSTEDRVFENGRVLCAARLHGGIDAALGLVARRCGNTTAQAVAGVVEYVGPTSVGP